MEEQRYIHNCDACVYIGREEEYDLFYCDTYGPSVIARFGDGGGEYSSAKLDASEYISQILSEAYKRAVHYGLVE